MPGETPGINASDTDAAMKKAPDAILRKSERPAYTPQPSLPLFPAMRAMSSR